MALRRHNAFFAVLSVSERAGYDPGFADDITWDFISNVNCITRNATLFSALESMKFADFAAWSEVRFTAMIKTALTLAVTTILKELTP